MNWSEHATFGFAAFGFLRALIELHCILFPNNRVSQYFHPTGFFTDVEQGQLEELISEQKKQVALLEKQVDLLQTLVDAVQHVSSSPRRDGTGASQRSLTRSAEGHRGSAQ